MSGSVKKKKYPILALILSGLLPGLGQMYNNQYRKGLILLALNFAIASLMRGPYTRLEEIRNAGGDIADGPTIFIVLGYSVAGLVLVVSAMIDAKKTADRINGESEASD